MAWRCSGINNENLVRNLFSNRLIQSDSVMRAMLAVDRANYCPLDPYDDSPQSIGYSATISAPHMHATVLELLKNNINKPNAHLLDIGCGSGYLSVAMANMNPSAHIIGIDYIPQLVELSINNTNKCDGDLLKSGRVEFHVGDGWEGFLPKSPYDAIHVGAAAVSLPIPLVRQLKVKYIYFICLFIFFIK